MSHNSECESDHIAVREKATVDALEKQVLEDLGADAVSGWGVACEEILLPKWAVLSFPRARQNAMPVCLCVCTWVHRCIWAAMVWWRLCV